VSALTAGRYQLCARFRLQQRQRSVGVCTGASQSARVAASAAFTVTEQPAISDDVT